ncbi:OpgC protein [Roseovarius albus]|uniref:OpgC protein n=1 Tax=Roseovarius albus TaxID=1247867 RepID=A0A1X6YMB6_9RHOB|nr:OpgC domain-containing protein [Roseovarius albus]SLN25005.1 OpgC protein [Roseovarius albus]
MSAISTTVPVMTSAVQPPAAAVSGVRDPRLDFYRGLAMFIILIAHVPGNFLTLWIPARFGFSDATEIFVFCSGMASAIAFGKVFAERSWWLGSARVTFRVWQVYWAHIGLFFTIAMLMAALNATELFDKNYINSLNLGHFFKNPEQQLIGLMTLTYVPNYFDILPMYLVILAMMPFMVALAQVNVWLMIGASLTIWLGAQFEYLDLPAEPWSDRNWFFNPFGWQLVFFTGFALMRGWIPAPPRDKRLMWLCIAIVLLSIPLAYFRVLNAFPELKPLRAEINFFIEKSDFGLFRYIHFLALAYLGWFVAGEQGRNLVARGTSLAARIWQQILTLILKVGQQSLAVFVVSMVIARLIGVGFDTFGRDIWVVWTGNLIGFAILIAVAYIAGWFKSNPWRKKRG